MAPAQTTGTRAEGTREKAAPTFLRSLWRVALGRYDVLLASLAVNLMTLALPIVVLQVYDRIIPNAATETFTLLVLGLFVAICLDLVLQAVRGHITAWSAARFEHATSMRAIDRVLGCRIEDFEKSAPGTHMDRLAAIESLRDFHSGQGLIAISDLPFVLLFLGLIYLIGGPIVAAPLAVVGVAGIFAMWVAGRLDRAVRDRADMDDKRYNFIFQSLNAIHSIKGLGAESVIARQYQGLHAPLAAVIEKVVYLSTLSQSLGATFGNIAMVSVAAAGSVLVINGDMTGGSLIACTLLAGRAVQPMIRMIGVWVQSRNLRIAEERLDYLMTLPQENRPDLAAGDEDAFNPDEFTGSIILDEVSVHRGRPDFPILKDVNLFVSPGEMIAVTGDMGAGRGTLLDLVSGLIRADAGEVLYDGVEASEIDFQKIRKRIAYVRQYAVLYRGTILDNLTQFQPEATSRALAFANALGLDEVIAGMPRGLQTRVGDTASEILAGSTQQVIALIRALSSAPQVLLFDEANSAFDQAADEKLRELFEVLRGQMTILMVTGRPSFIRMADRVIEVGHGEVHEIEAGEAAYTPPRPTPLEMPGNLPGGGGQA
ncbi:MAG: peptidase domain-containing ABC transporter [Magnetovibrionaceae bacterium]